MSGNIRNIVAVLDTQPPGPPKAWVTADVEVPDLGSTAKLVKRVPQGINPTILILDVVVSSSGNPSGQQLAWCEVRFDEDPAAQQYVSVEIHYGATVCREDFKVVA